MFWDTKDPPSHYIEILLESPDTKVEAFLEEVNIIQECKTLKKNIVSYFTRPDVIRRMIELITTEPPEETPINERFRHANVACEILTMGLPSLNEKLLAETDTLNILYSYLENEPPLNPLLASFFSKTFSMLFTKKSDQDWFLYQQTCLKLLEYLKTKSNFLDLICKHFTTPIVPDLILEMMQNVDGPQLKKSLFEWLNEERLIEKLIEIIGDPEQSEKHANVADFLCDLIHQGRTMRQENDSFEPVYDGSDPILQKIESATTLLALFNVILQPNNAESAIVSGITVVLKIIKSAEVIDDRNMSDRNMFSTREKKIHDEFLTTVIRVIEPQIKSFNELLKTPPKKTDIVTSAATLSPPFGMARLQIVRLFTELLEKKNNEISKAICETDFLDTLIALFKEYCWNNFLHSEVEKCLHSIFPYSNNLKTKINIEVAQANDDAKESTEAKTSKEPNYVDPNEKELGFLDKMDFFKDLIAEFEPESTPASNQSDIQVHAIVKCQIISKLIECWKMNKEIESAEKGRRLGFMGHLINIFKHITKCISESEHIGALVQNNLKDDSERDLWQSIVNTTDGELTKALTAQSKLLANYEPSEYNVSLDFFTDSNISDTFNGLCNLTDSSDAFGRRNEYDDGDDDDNAGGLSYYVEPRVNPFTIDDSVENYPDICEMIDEYLLSPKLEGNTVYHRAYAELCNMFSRDGAATNTNKTASVSSAATPSIPTQETNVLTTTSSEEFDNNANVEKSSSWSGDFTSFQIPKKDTEFTSNFFDDYEDDEGMWTKPLGASAITTTVQHLGTQSTGPFSQTDGLKANFITNGPSVLEASEPVPEESSLNQLNNSIEDNNLVDQTTEDIKTSKDKDELNKETNNEETTSEHNSNTPDSNETETETTTTTPTPTTNAPTNQQTNTATTAEEISDVSTTSTTTT